MCIYNGRCRTFEEKEVVVSRKPDLSGFDFHFSAILKGSGFLILIESKMCFGEWPKRDYFNSFLKEDYYVQEIDLFCFGAGLHFDEHSQCCQP